MVVHLGQNSGAFGGEEIMLLFLFELQGQSKNDGQQARNGTGNHQMSEQVVEADKGNVQADGYSRHHEPTKQGQQNLASRRSHAPPSPGKTFIISPSGSTLCPYTRPL